MKTSTPVSPVSSNDDGESPIFFYAFMGAMAIGLILFILMPFLFM